MSFYQELEGRKEMPFSLSRLRGRAGVEVLPHNVCRNSQRGFPPPAARYARVDLPRKRER
jgi:hypothetical protein